MPTNNEIKLVSSLQHKKYRKQHGMFVAEGNKLVCDLISSQPGLVKVYALPQWIEKNPSFINILKDKLIQVNQKELVRMGGLVSNNQVLAIFTIPDNEFDFTILSMNTVLMLDDIQDPGNLGTIIRTADWFGIYHLLCSESSVDVFNPKTIQATMGSVARVKVYYTDLDKVLQLVKGQINIYGSLLSGKCVNECKFESPSILMIGNEAHGISTDLHKYITHPVFIPPYQYSGPGVDRPESLNASVAAGILCWELFKSTIYD